MGNRKTGSQLSNNNNKIQPMLLYHVGINLRKYTSKKKWKEHRKVGGSCYCSSGKRCSLSCYIGKEIDLWLKRICLIVDLVEKSCQLWQVTCW